MKHEPYSRRVLGGRFDVWAARNRYPIVVVGAWAVAALVAVSAPLLVGHVRAAWVWYIVGFFHAAIVGCFVAMLYAVFLATDREAIHHFRGAWGEDNTRDSLRKAQRRGLIWGWVDSVMLARGDLDHLVVTRAGGVVAIDSKWRNQIREQDREAILDAARKVRLRSDGVLHSLLGSEQGSHRSRGRAVSVTPLVVVWGAAQSGLPDVVRTDGVEVVPGRRLLAWLRQHDGNPVDEAAARDLIRELEDFRDRLATSHASNTTGAAR